MYPAISVHVRRADSDDKWLFVVLLVNVDSKPAGKTMLSFQPHGFGGAGLPRDLPIGPNWLSMRAFLEASPTEKPQQLYAEWLQKQVGTEWVVTADLD